MAAAIETADAGMALETERAVRLQLLKSVGQRGKLVGKGRGGLIAHDISSQGMAA